MKTIFLSGLLPFFFLFIFVSSVHAATLTVCSSGCTYTAVNTAVAAASTGDIIKVGPGSYAGFVLTKQITIEGTSYDKQNPRLNPAKITSNITIQDGSWAPDQGPVFRGLSLYDPAYAITGFSPYTLEYSYVSAKNDDGVSFEKGGGGIVRGNLIENTGDDCIDVDNQTKDILIENNQLLNCGEDGLETRQHDDTIPSRATLTLRNNIIDTTVEDGIQIMDYNNFLNRRYILSRNIFRNIGKAAIGLMQADVTNENYSAAAMPEPLYVVNNTFINNDAGISGGANVIAINNLFMGQKTFDLKAVGGKSKIMNTVFAAIPKLQGTNNLDNATTIMGDPRLDSSYVPLVGSPAIDAGIANYSYSYTLSSQTFNDVVLNYQAGDFMGTAPDVGAKESGFSTSPTATVTLTTTPSITPSNTPTVTPTSVPTITQPSNGNCPKKYIGDADCKADPKGKYVNILDYAIWYAEATNGCSESDLNKCGTNADGIGNAMDSNFNFPGTNYIATDMKVDSFDYAVWIQGFLAE